MTKTNRLPTNKAILIPEELLRPANEKISPHPLYKAQVEHFLTALNQLDGARLDIAMIILRLMAYRADEQRSWQYVPPGEAARVLGDNA